MLGLFPSASNSLPMEMTRRPATGSARPCGGGPVGPGRRERKNSFPPVLSHPQSTRLRDCPEASSLPFSNGFPAS